MCICSKPNFLINYSSFFSGGVKALTRVLPEKLNRYTLDMHSMPNAIKYKKPAHDLAEISE